MITKEKGMNNKVLKIKPIGSYLVLGLLGFLFFLPSCKTTPPPTLDINPNAKVKDVEVKKIEPIKDIEVVELPFSSKWNSDYYKKFNETNYDKFQEFKKRIDFSKIDYSLLNAAVFYETNLRRRENDLPSLEFSPALERVSSDHSKEMVKMDFYSHTSPAKGRETPVKRMEFIGISNAYSAENINIGFGIMYKPGQPVYPPSENKSDFFSYTQNGPPILPQTYMSLATDVVESWMNSPGHRRNILNENLKYMGVGSAHYKDAKAHKMDKFKFTQSFASIPGIVPK